MFENTPHLSHSDFLKAVANAEEANGLTINADEFRRRAIEVRTLERRLEELEAANAKRVPAVPVESLRKMIADVESGAST